MNIQKIQTLEKLQAQLRSGKVSKEELRTLGFHAVGGAIVRLSDPDAGAKLEERIAAERAADDES